MKKIYSFKNEKTLEDDVDQMLEQIKRQVATEKAEQAETPGYLEVFTSSKYRWCTIFCIVSAVIN